jgi:flagellin
LERIDDAIVAKDKVRANFGATQNRLENTVTNLTIMAENMLSAESRISDADIGAEMMVFVKNQILTQSSVAMLSQANTWPHMMMSLIGG